MKCRKCGELFTKVEGAATKPDQCEGCFLATLNPLGRGLAEARTREPVQTSRAQLYRDFTRSTIMPRPW